MTKYMNNQTKQIDKDNHLYEIEFKIRIQDLTTQLNIETTIENNLFLVSISLLTPNLTLHQL